MTTLSLIVARSKNGVIGCRGGIPWHIPADMKFFKATTLGHPIIMGRRTWESIGRPLPGRKNIVLSRSHTELIDGITIVRTLEDALRLIPENEKAFVIGGAETYRAALPRLDEAYITEIDKEFNGDTYFTITNPEQWTIEKLGTFNDGGCSGAFTRWTRKNDTK